MNPDPHQVKAIHEFTLSVTLPLCLLSNDGPPLLLATGNIFRIEGRTFLVTARHAFDRIDPIQLHFPHKPRGGRFHGFEEIVLARPTQDHIDVAVIEFTSPAVLAILEQDWGALSLENVAVRPETGLRSFVAGYPSSLTRHEPDHLQGQLIFADTILMGSPPSLWNDDYVPELDLFFSYSSMSSDVNGNKIQTPKLPGVSGAAVWQLRESGSSVWTAESSMQVLGVQSAYVPGSYLRAKNWWAVASVLSQIDESLAAVLRNTAVKADQNSA